ncbi:hypothetical protein ID866_3555, partial [Astraeus odoratus]
MSVISIGAPLGTGRSTCGYCGPPGERSATQSSFTKGGLIASQLKCGASVPQNVILPGLRHPSRLDALAFKPSRNQRKLINRKKIRFSLAEYRNTDLLQVALERSSYTDEKYALFKTYQAQVHRDHDTTSTSFTHFLVQTPLI